MFIISTMPAALAAPISDTADTNATPSGGEQLLTLDVTDTPLKTVVQLLMRDSGMNIILADSDKMDARVTVSQKDKPLETILRNVVAAVGVKFTRTSDGTFMIGDNVDVQETKPAPVTQDNNVAAPAPIAPKPKRRTTQDLIKLQFISPKQAMVLLGALPADVALNQDAHASIWRGGKLDVFRGMWGPKVDMYEVENKGAQLSPYNPGSTINVFPAAPTSDSTNPAIANRTTEPNLTSDQYRSGYSTQYTRGSTTQTTTTGRPGTTGGVTSSSGGDDLRPDGIDAIIPFEQDNSLLVKGEDDAVQELKDLITLVDIPPKQVMIKAEFIEVSTNITKRLGVDWLLSRPNAAVQTNFLPSGNVLAFVQSGNLTANLRAELTDSGGKIVNAPIISTLNNTAASISVGKQIPFYQQVTQNNGQTLVTTSNVTYIDASTQLQVLPQINGDNSITLILAPQVSDSSGFVQGPDGQQAPQISQQVLSTARRVANGETIVVGGFIKKNDSNGRSRVPILSELPIIGGLFRSKFNTKADTETLIFITPTVIEDKGTGQAVGVVTP